MPADVRFRHQDLPPHRMSPRGRNRLQTTHLPLDGRGKVLRQLDWLGLAQQTWRQLAAGEDDGTDLCPV